MKRIQQGLLLIAAALVGALVLPATPALAATGLSQTPSPSYQTNGRVSAIVTVGDMTIIGGSFTAVRPSGAALGVNEVARNRLAAFDATSGALLPWNPGADGSVTAIAPSQDGSSVYVGGKFSKVDGANRKNLAQVSLASGDVTSWAPSTSGLVLAILPTAAGIVVGGAFTSVNGQAYQHLARINGSGTVDPSWTTWTDDRVRAIIASPDGSKLLVGGEFTTTNGSTNGRHLIALNPTSGAFLASQPERPGYPVYDLTATGNSLYVAGNGSGGHVSGYNLTSGAKQWTIQTDGGVVTVALVDGVVVAGGHFNNVCLGVYDGATNGFKCPTNQAVRKKLVALDPTTGVIDPWNPSANSSLGVWSLAPLGTSLLVGGDFTKIGSPGADSTPTYSQQGFARFNLK
jgi:trimeric autotransporter adhesin